MRFLLIRPIEESRTLAKKLEKIGHHAITDPVLNITALAPPEIDITPYQALVFTSSVAVRIFVENYTFPELTVFTVGNKTAHAAKKYGCQNVVSADGDADKLAQLIKSNADALNGPLLYLSASDIAKDLNELLKDFIIDRVIVYSANQKTTFEKMTLNALRKKEIDYIPFYSSRSALIFKDIINKTNMAENLSHVTALCLSSNVAKSVKDLPWKNTFTAAKPTEAELFKLIGIDL